MNELLQRIRALRREVRGAEQVLARKAEGDSNDDEINAGRDVADLALELASAIEELDQRMTAGEFVPDAWLPTRMAMLQAEYRRGFEAAMLRNRASRLQVPAAPIHVGPEPLGPPNPAGAEWPDDPYCGKHGIRFSSVVGCPQCIKEL